MLKEIKKYLESSDSHYIRSYQIGRRGLTDFSCAADPEFSYRMYFLNDSAFIHKVNGQILPETELVESEKTEITKSEYDEILNLVKSYI